jgi:hypothetical protein
MSQKSSLPQVTRFVSKALPPDSEVIHRLQNDGPGSGQIVDGAEALLTTAQDDCCDDSIDFSDSIRSPFACRLD